MCNLCIGIYEVKFTLNMHILHEESYQILSAVNNGLVGKRDGATCGDQFADHRKITDRGAPVEPLQRIAPLCHRLLQEHPGAGTALPDDEIFPEDFFQRNCPVGKGMIFSADTHETFLFKEVMGVFFLVEDTFDDGKIQFAPGKKRQKILGIIHNQIQVVMLPG